MIIPLMNSAIVLVYFHFSILIPETIIKIQNTEGIINDSIPWVKAASNNLKKSIVLLDKICPKKYHTNAN